MLTEECGSNIKDLLMGSDLDLRLSILDDESKIFEWRNLIKEFMGNKFSYDYKNKVFNLKFVIIDKNGAIREKAYNGVDGREVISKFNFFILGCRAVKVIITLKEECLFTYTWLFAKNYK